MMAQKAFDLEIRFIGKEVQARSSRGEIIPGMLYLDDFDTRAIRAMLRSESRSDFETAGSRLFDAVFRERIEILYRNFIDAVRAENQSAVLHLVFDEPTDETIRLPWELLYDPEDRSFLAASRSISLLRGRPPRKELADHTLAQSVRVGFAVASPQDLTAINTEPLTQAINHKYPGVEAYWLIDPNLGGLDDWLHKNLFDIVHLVSHAKTDVEGWFAALPREDGNTEWVEGRALLELLQAAQPRVVVLASPESASLFEAGAWFEGFVGFQFKVTSRTLSDFAMSFYEAIASGSRFDEAVGKARRRLFTQETRLGLEGTSPGWAAPVAYATVARGEPLILVPQAETREPPKADVKPEKKPEKPTPTADTSEDEHQARRNYVPLLSDQPAKVDMLKRQHLADVIASKLDDLREDPATDSFMLLLDGPWGAGKTTILGFVQKVLESSHRMAAETESRERGQSQDYAPAPWIIIPFNAWRQSHVGPAWWGLLSNLKVAVSNHLGQTRRQWFRLWEIWRLTAPQFGLAWILVILALAWLMIAAVIDRGITLSAKDIGELAKSLASVVSLLVLVWTAGEAVFRRLAWGSPRGAKVFEDTRANPMGDLAGHFHWLLQMSPGPVLFVVDDLDRCEQQYVVSFLDAVQTLMHNPQKDKANRQKLFFVVAADGRWIRRSYEIAHDKYVETVAEPGRSLGYLFLDKLFQVSVPVPALGEKLRSVYLSELLGERANPENQVETTEEEVIHQITPDQREELKSLEYKIEMSETQEEILRILKENEVHREALAIPALRCLNTPGLTEATNHVLEPYAELLDPNPRSIKRFLMAYNFTRDVRLLEGFSPAEDALARWTIVRLRWPELADCLRNQPAAIHENQRDDIPEKLKKLLNSPDVLRVVAPLGTDGIRESAGYADFAPPGTKVPEKPTEKI